MSELRWLLGFRQVYPQISEPAAMIRLSFCCNGTWLSACWELVLVLLPLLFYPQSTHLFVSLSLQSSLPALRRI
jgi:hypothetical protein